MHKRGDLRGRGVKRTPVTLVCLLGLSACASVPAPAGPVLPPGPEHGRIEQGVYHDRRGWFQVNVPLHPGEEGYDSLYVEENYPKNVSFVSFTPFYAGNRGYIPTFASGEYYRAYVEDFIANGHLVPEMDTLADMAMTFFGKLLSEQRIEPLHLVEQRPWQAGATTGVVRLYTQKVPMELAVQNLGMGEDYTAYVLVYITTLDSRVTVLWSEWPVGCEPCRPVPAGQAAATDDPIDRAFAANARAGVFFASFAYGPV